MALPLAIPLTFTALSGLFKTIGDDGAYSAQIKQYEQEEKVALLNADTTAYNTAFNENIMRQAQRQSLAKISAQQAENGLGGSDMALFSLGQSTLNSEKDIMTQRNKGLNEMFNFRYRAAVARANAQAARKARGLGGLSNILGTAASMASFFL